MRTNHSPTFPATLLVALSLLLTGCAANTQTRDNLSAAYRELDAPSPNYATMLQAADAYLAETPTGPGAAEAHYLRGRALEAKSQRDLASPENDLAQAHAAYTAALAQAPRPALEGLIRAGLGNVLYFQDRYAAAVNELTASIDKLERDPDKAWALYRIGLSQQRLAQWADADKTFAAVQQQFPNTEQARRAREHAGARNFWVQVGTYATPALADAAVADLKKQGIMATKFADPSAKGPQYVRVGPLETYQSAQQTKNRVWAKYPTTIIVP